MSLIKSENLWTFGPPKKRLDKFFKTWKCAGRFKNCLSGPLDPEKRVEWKQRISLDIRTQKKSEQILEDLKNLRENSKIACLDPWTPKKELNEKRESLWTFGLPKKTWQILEHLKNCRTPGPLKKSSSKSSIWRFEALELNMTIWFGRFYHPRKKVFAFFGGI